MYPVYGRVTVAGENTFTSGGSPDGDQTESTGLGHTVLEATVPETTVPEDVEKSVEGTEEATVVVHEEPKEPGKKGPGAGDYGGIQEDERIEKAGETAGKPEHAQGGKKHGKLRVAGKPPAQSGPATGRPDHVVEKNFDGNPGKVTICHKKAVTISVGAPAKPAHLRHGDVLDPAEAEGFSRR